MAERLASKSAMVVGVGPIGSEIVRTFAAEGARVWCIDVDANLVDAAVRSASGRAAGEVADATDRDTLRGAIDNGFSWLGGRLDVFATTVGGRGFPRPFLDLDQATWADVVSRNLTAVFLASQLAANHMVAAGNGGSIVVTSSQLGLVGAPGLAHYCAVKGGLSQFVKVLALELAEHGIRANALAPGVTRSIEREKAAGSELDEATEATARRVVSQVPLGRFGRPKEIANAALFLGSEESSYVTGATLVVDGGFVIH